MKDIKQIILESEQMNNLINILYDFINNKKLNKSDKKQIRYLINDTEYYNQIQYQKDTDININDILDTITESHDITNRIINLFKQYSNIKTLKWLCGRIVNNWSDISIINNDNDINSSKNINFALTDIIGSNKLQNISTLYNLFKLITYKINNQINQFNKELSKTDKNANTLDPITNELLVKLSNINGSGKVAIGKFEILLRLFLPNVYKAYNDYKLSGDVNILDENGNSVNIEVKGNGARLCGPSPIETKLTLNTEDKYVNFLSFLQLSLNINSKFMKMPELKNKFNNVSNEDANMLLNIFNGKNIYYVELYNKFNTNIDKLINSTLKITNNIIVFEEIYNKMFNNNFEILFDKSKNIAEILFNFIISLFIYSYKDNDKNNYQKTLFNIFKQNYDDIKVLCMNNNKINISGIKKLLFIFDLISYYYTEHFNYIILFGNKSSSKDLAKVTEDDKYVIINCDSMFSNPKNTKLLINVPIEASDFGHYTSGGQGRNNFSQIKFI